jgi:hypothetical protein
MGRCPDVLAWVFTVIFYGGLVKAGATRENFAKTRLKNLVRHLSGHYYARLFLNGKEIWKSLGPSHFSLTVARRQHRARRAKVVDPANAGMTFGRAPTHRTRRLAGVGRATAKKCTREYWQEAREALRP